MTGWRTKLGEHEAPKGVIGIIVAQKFPEPDLIRTKLIEGISRVHPDTVWVVRNAPKSNDAVTFAWDTFKEFEIEPILAGLVPYWKGPDKDRRAEWRDAEIRATCERIIVFHDKSSNITAEWKNCDHSIAKIYVVERGKKKAAPRKGRKPVGV